MTYTACPLGKITRIDKSNFWRCKYTKYFWKFQAFWQFFFYFLASLEIYSYICKRNIWSNPQNKTAYGNITNDITNILWSVRFDSCSKKSAKFQLTTRSIVDGSRRSAWAFTRWSSLGVCRYLWNVSEVSSSRFLLCVN